MTSENASADGQRPRRRFPWHVLLVAWVPFMTGVFESISPQTRKFAVWQFGGAGCVLVVIGLAYLVFRLKEAADANK